MADEAVIEPSALYYKAERMLLIFSGALIAQSAVGLDSTEGGSSILSLKITDPSKLGLVLSAVVIYYLVKLPIHWNAQNSVVRDRLNFQIEFGVAILVGLTAVGICIYETYREIILGIVGPANSFGEAAAKIGSVVLAVAATLLVMFISQKLRDRTQTVEKAIEAAIVSRLVNNDWILVFNPHSQKGRKRIAFVPDGTIGQGRNENEFEWRVRGGYLEILNNREQVFSRFKYDDDRNLFTHSNDRDTLSLRDQRIELKGAGKNDAVE